MNKKPHQEEQRFPISGGLTISRQSAEKAFETYARLFGADQTLERIGDRGGFGLQEFVWLYRGARKERISDWEMVRALAEADIRKEL
jgi:hypothetical protein